MEGTSRAVLRREEMDLAELELFGKMLDERAPLLGEETIGMFLMRSLLRVRAKTGKTVPLKANCAQSEFELRRGSENIILKARQMGLTTWVAGRFFLRTITRPGTMSLQVAHTQEAAEEIFRIIHRFVENLPEGLSTGVLRTSRSSVRQIAFPEIDASYRVASAGDRNAGRGLTVQNLHISELARWPGDAADTLAGLRAAMTPDAELVIESTPDGAGGCFYEEWMGAEQAGVVRHFFPWWMDAGYRAAAVNEASLTEEESALMKSEGLDLERIGFRRKIRAGMRGMAAQEYAESPETCFLVSGDPVFEMSAIEERLKFVPDPALKRWNEQLSVWLPSIPGKRYVVAVDPAGGGADGDWSVAQVLEMETGLQCAEFAAHLGGLELARKIVELATEYNDAWLVIERNNHGSGVLAYVEQSCRYRQVYEQCGQPGWLTSSLTRPRMLGLLGTALAERPDCFHSRDLLTECRTFVRLPGGGTGARSGAHDDRVMAMAIGWSAREELLMIRR